MTSLMTPPCSTSVPRRCCSLLSGWRQSARATRTCWSVVCISRSQLYPYDRAATTTVACCSTALLVQLPRFACHTPLNGLYCMLASLPCPALNAGQTTQFLAGCIAVIKRHPASRAVTVIRVLLTPYVRRDCVSTTLLSMCHLPLHSACWPCCSVPTLRMPSSLMATGRRHTSAMQSTWTTCTEMQSSERCGGQGVSLQLSPHTLVLAWRGQAASLLASTAQAARDGSGLSCCAFCCLAAGVLLLDLPTCVGEYCCTHADA